MATPVLAQDETLISGKIESGGFGGPVVKFTQVTDEFGVLVGGRGGWIINHTFVIGGGGYGLANEIKAKQIGPDTLLYLSLGYGGLELEYVHASNKLIHSSIQVLIGAGGVNYTERDNHSERGREGDTFFVVEPGVNLILNVAKSFRVGVGASYRFISGVNFNGLSNGDLSGPAATLTFKFGKF